MPLCKVCLVLAITLANSLARPQESQDRVQINWDSVEASIKGVPTYKPKNGLVPDEATAIRIAQAVLEPIYGQNKINAERPFRTHLSNGTWTVIGSMHSALLGGVAVVKISQADGRVIFVVHQQ